MKNQVAILAVAIIVLVAGIVMYVHSDNNYAACQSTIGGIVRALDPASSRDCENAKNERYAGIAIMVVGAIALLAGAFPARKTA